MTIKMFREFKRVILRMSLCSLYVLMLLALQGCYSPVDSQQYFAKATNEDRALEPIYSTSLYTVYFDYALSRCVIHSAHTWGQSGGGGGGTGIGISAFRCEPSQLRDRAKRLGLEVYPPKMRVRRAEPRNRQRPAPPRPAPQQPAAAPAPASPPAPGGNP